MDSVSVSNPVVALREKKEAAAREAAAAAEELMRAEQKKQQTSDVEAALAAAVSASSSSKQAGAATASTSTPKPSRSIISSMRRASSAVAASAKIKAKETAKVGRDEDDNASVWTTRTTDSRQSFKLDPAELARRRGMPAASSSSASFLAMGGGVGIGGGGGGGAGSSAARRTSLSFNAYQQAVKSKAVARPLGSAADILVDDDCSVVSDFSDEVSVSLPPADVKKAPYLGLGPVTARPSLGAADAKVAAAAATAATIAAAAAATNNNKKRPSHSGGLPLEDRDVKCAVMVQWFTEHLEHHITPATARQYAHALYDANMPSMLKVAKKLSKDRRCLKALQIEDDDVEEMILAMEATDLMIKEQHTGQLQEQERDQLQMRGGPHSLVGSDAATTISSIQDESSTNKSQTSSDIHLLSYDASPFVNMIAVPTQRRGEEIVGLLVSVFFGQSWVDGKIIAYAPEPKFLHRIRFCDGETLDLELWEHQIKIELVAITAQFAPHATPEQSLRSTYYPREEGNRILLAGSGNNGGRGDELKDIEFRIQLLNSHLSNLNVNQESGLDERLKEIDERLKALSCEEEEEDNETMTTNGLQSLGSSTEAELLLQEQQKQQQQLIAQQQQQLLELQRQNQYQQLLLQQQQQQKSTLASAMFSTPPSPPQAQPPQQLNIESTPASGISAPSPVSLSARRASANVSVDVQPPFFSSPVAAPPPVATSEGVSSSHTSSARRSTVGPGGKRSSVSGGVATPNAALHMPSLAVETHKPTFSDPSSSSSSSKTSSRPHPHPPPPPPQSSTFTSSPFTAASATSPPPPPPPPSQAFSSSQQTPPPPPPPPARSPSLSVNGSHPPPPPPPPPPSSFSHASSPDHEASALPAERRASVKASGVALPGVGVSQLQSILSGGGASALRRTSQVRFSS